MMELLAGRVSEEKAILVIYLNNVVLTAARLCFRLGLEIFILRIGFVGLHAWFLRIFK